MTKKEFSQALRIAQSNEEDLPKDLNIFDGFGLPDFKPVHVTIRDVAALLRWQGLYFDGVWDAEEINEVAQCGRRRFLIV